MSILRYMASFLCALFGLYCVIWGLVASSASIAYHIDGVFFGILLLLLAFAHFRIVLPLKSGENIPSERA
jgi:hypothetical protein